MSCLVIIFFKVIVMKMIVQKNKEEVFRSGVFVVCILYRGLFVFEECVMVSGF